MSDKLVDFTWRHDEQQAHGVMNIKAGDTTKVPERDALRMQLNGHGTIGKVLKPHVHDQAALDKFRGEERAKWKKDHPELAPKPGTEPIGSAYRHMSKFHPANQGWGV
jgi:hypothetical protein